MNKRQESEKWMVKLQLCTEIDTFFKYSEHSSTMGT